jgi:predicted TPR repeat methyltransferase
MAQALAGVCEVVEGVDLSPRMLAKAEKTRLYAQLHEGDLVAFLAGRLPCEADLVVAADVFVYLADLSPAFHEIRRVLAPRGFLGFTVQAHAGAGVELGDDSRYAHGEAYLRSALHEAGLATVLFEAVSTREDRGQPVPGFLVVAQA